MSGFITFLTSQSVHLVFLFVFIGALALAFAKQSAHLRYLLWLVILVKCLVPPLVTIPMAVLPERVAVVEADTIPAESVEPSSIVPVVESEVVLEDVVIQNDSIAAEMSPELSVATATEKNWTVWQWGVVVWMMGGGLYLLITVVRGIRFTMMLRRTRQAVNFRVETHLDALADEYWPGRTVIAYELPDIAQPFVWGLWGGTIYLPDRFYESLSEERRASVLLHELAHVMRCDPLVNLQQILVQAVYWFHPLVWFANKMIRAEREKCCDEIALAKLKTSPKVYGGAILDTLVQEYESSMIVPTLAVAGPVKNIEDRIKTIMKPGKRFYSRPSFLGLVTILLLACVVTPTAIALVSREPVPSSLENEPSSDTALEPVPVISNTSKPDSVDQSKPTVMSETGMVSQLQAFGDMSQRVYEALQKGNKQQALATYDLLVQQIPTALKFIEGTPYESMGALMHGQLLQIRTLIEDDQFKQARDAIKALQNGGTMMRTMLESSVPAEKKRESKPRMSQAEAQKKVYSLFMSGGPLCMEIQSALEKDDMDTAWVLIQQGDGLIEEFELISDQVPEGDMFKALAKLFKQWRKVIQERDKDLALKLGRSINAMGEQMVPMIERMQKTSDETTQPAQPPASSKTIVVPETKSQGRLTGRAESITLESCTLPEALRMVAAIYRVNIIPTKNVQGEIPDLELYDVNYIDALDAILGDHKYTDDGRFIRVYTAEEYAAFSAEKSGQAQPKVSEAEVRKKLFELFITGGTLCSEIQEALERGDMNMAVVFIEQSGSIVNEFEPLAKQLPERDVFKAPIELFHQWKQAILDRDKEKAVKLGRTLMDMGAQVAPMMERMYQSSTKENVSLKGKLEFRIVPTVEKVAVTSFVEMVERYRKDLQESGLVLNREVEKDYIWLPVRMEKVRPDVIVGEYEGIQYMLVSNMQDQVMLADGSWGLVSAQQVEDAMGRRAIGIEMDEVGGDRLFKVSSNNLDRPLSIILDGVVLSAPTINSAVRERAIITGSFTEKETYDIVEALKKGMMTEE